MSTKKKLIVSITILCLTVVTAIVSVIGVFALLNTEFTFGGSISFSTTSVYATVSQATVNGQTDATKMQEIFIDTENDGSVAKSTWSGVSLNFPENGNDVVIKFTITNHSEVDKLRVTIGELTGTYDNATMTVALTEGLDGVTTCVLDETTGESTAIIDKAVAGTPATEYSAEVVITFHITDKNKDASITGFNIPISLEKFDEYIVIINCYNVPGPLDHGYPVLIGIITDLDTNLKLIGHGDGDITYRTIGKKLIIAELNTSEFTFTDSEGTVYEITDGTEIELTKDMVFSLTFN